VVIDASDYFTKEQAGKTKNSAISSTKVANNLTAGFNLVAALRGPHWHKSATDVMPLAEPLALWLSSLPAHVRKNIEQYSLPLSILVGAVVVLGEPIKYEIEITNIQRQQRKQGRPSSAAATPGPVQAGNDTGFNGRTQNQQPQNPDPYSFANLGLPISDN
jgi:hypothetical protein